MTTIEAAVSTDGRYFAKYFFGRVIPHAAVLCYLMVSLSPAVSTVHRHLWIFLVSYGIFTLAHTWLAYKRVRFPIVAAATLLATFAISGGAHLISPHTETGSYVGGVISLFLVIILWFSAVNNHWFVAARWYYPVEILLLNTVWIALVLARLESGAAQALAVSLPVFAYSLYVLLFDYTGARHLDAEGRRKVFLRYLAALLVLLAGMLLGYYAGGPGGAETPSSRSYSLLSSRNDRFLVQDRAKLEDELKLPLDSKELVFVANIDPVVVDYRSYNIGYYLKFHSLYNYDPAGMEFNGLADEMEDPAFRVRLVPLQKTMLDPAHLTVGLDGKEMIPPYRERVDGRTVIYNVKLDTDQNFGQNLTYRFISYPANDSISVAERTFPLLGIHKLFNKVSLLNLIPIGTAGELFQYDFNKLVLQRIGAYPDLDRTPLSFAQRYLNTGGVEQDILDTARALASRCRTTPDKIAAVIRWFTRKSRDGRHVFSYDLKPGKSVDPAEGLLHYFLFTSHRGYCTYYATASALFFRAAGIPARVAIGFVPGESSKQNPGWYYVYSNQAHAWTEIYLGPSLGWMDLDLTPAGESSGAPPPPQPTPPTPPQPLDAQYSLSGIVTVTGDSLRCDRVTVSRRDEAQDIAVCGNAIPGGVALVFDTTRDARVGISEERRLATEVAGRLRAGDSVVAIGSQGRNPRVPTCSFDVFVFHRITAPARAKTDSARTESRKDTRKSWWRSPLPYLVLGLALIILLFSAPSIHRAALRRSIHRAASESARLRKTRDWLMLTMHLGGFPSVNETDMEYSARMEADKGIAARDFFGQYLRARYFGAAPSDRLSLCTRLIEDVERQEKTSSGVFRILVRRLNLWEYIRFINRRKTA
jgi:transglutaminase-like putative cysteine protease